jgi:hypothetical protein
MIRQQSVSLETTSSLVSLPAIPNIPIAPEHHFVPRKNKEKVVRTHSYPQFPIPVCTPSRQRLLFFESAPMMPRRSTSIESTSSSQEQHAVLNKSSQVERDMPTSSHFQSEAAPKIPRRSISIESESSSSKQNAVLYASSPREPTMTTPRHFQSEAAPKIPRRRISIDEKVSSWSE